MQRRYLQVLALAFVLPLLMAGCDMLGFRNWQWHQRLVIEVETPNGLVSGGSVVAVKAGTSPKWLPGEGAGGMGSKTLGEASFVEIAPGRYLFALLGNETELALTLFFPPPAPNTFERAERLETLLVTFADISDPATVRRVDPQDLAGSFGPGVALTRITLEITDDKVTEGAIERALPWLATIGGGMLDGARISSLTAENRLANDLSRLNFKRD